MNSIEYMLWFLKDGSGLLFLLLFILLWSFHASKGVLFYLYLWQLKEYRIPRLVDHFRTEKGKQLLWNNILALKIFLGIVFVGGLLANFHFFSISWESFIGAFALFAFVILLFIYVAEALKIIQNVVKQRLIKPTFTRKIQLLFLVNILVFSVLVSIVVSAASPIDSPASFFAILLVFLALDIFTPFVVSVAVLSFQPLAEFAKRRIFKKAEEKRKELRHVKVVGITGSYGKTSTKEFLSHILSSKFEVLKTKEHQNSEMGVSLCILNELQPFHEIFVCEMGAYKKGEIKLLCDIAKPEIGIITGVNEQHLALFGSMDNLLSGEGGKELVDALPEDGVAIFNGNNRYTQELYEKTDREIRKIRKVLCYNTFGAIAPNVLSMKSDIWAENVKVGKESVSFAVFTESGEKADFQARLLGGHNVENILLAAAAAKELGMNLAEIARACESITQEMGAMKLKKGVNGLTIIDSTYSANPDGVIAALEYLKAWEGRKVIVMPCLIELGKVSKEVHQKIGEKIGEVCDLAIITKKDWFDELKQGAMSKGMEEGQILFQEDSQKIFDMIKNVNHKEDVILLESRVPSRLIELVND